MTIDEGPFGEPRWYVTAQGIAESVNALETAKERAREQDRLDRLNADRERLVSAAANYPAGETLRQIRDRAGLSGTKATSALAEALKAGELEPCQITKNNKTVDGYRVPNE